MSTLAERYAQMRDTTRVHERALFVSPRIPSELELQARWFAGDFGKHFVSTTGDKIDIVQFGVWNREAGPDFRDAAIQINGSEPIRGCIEIDLLDRSWETHGHATNPAFDATVLHVFVERTDREFFTPLDSAGGVQCKRSAGATGALPGAAQRFAGRTRVQRAGRFGAISFAAKSEPDSHQDRRPWTRRDAFPGDRQRARLQGKQTAVHAARPAVAAPVAARKR
ncbi:MAG: hypothetical protein DME33_11530 [Verrucomicrobia bacterium]|nr:MAG: hypothetical protein DME33_11530 [Verrucomicrobiota bacterium]